MKPFNKNSLARWSVALTAALVLASCGGDNDDDPIVTGSATPTGTGSAAGGASLALPENTFAITLTGAQEVPAVTTSATGTGAVIVDPATLVMKATIVTAGITGSAVHIHVGPRGIAGPVVFPLTQTSAGSGIWTTQATLTTAQLNELRAGNYYFNVHTAAYPNGEIRGQIQQGSSTGSSGSGTAGAGTGTGGITGSGTTGTGTTGTAATGTSTSGIGATGTGTAGAAATGTTGTSSPGSGAIGIGATGTGATATGTTGSAATLSGNAFVVSLAGAQEVPPVTTNAVGIGIAVVDPATSVMRAAIVTNGLNGNAAHIHVGQRGAAGPIVFPFTQTSAGSGIWTTQATLTTAQLNELRAGSYYFNVHTAANPNGEIRGQILQGSATGTTGTSAGATGATGTTGTGGTGTAGTTGTTGTATTGAGAATTGSAGTAPTPGSGTTGATATSTSTTGAGTGMDSDTDSYVIGSS